MSKKIIIFLLIIIIIFHVATPVIVSASSEDIERISTSAQLNYYKAEAVEENEMTGLDLISGILIEPTVEFFTFILDSIMSVFSGIMTQEEIKFVMVDSQEKDELLNSENVGATYTLDNIDGYKTASGSLENLKYPRFTYTPEDIFAGKIDLLDINFIKASNTDTNWLKIRTVVADWYKILRMISIIGLLSVLIYTGIKIIASSNVNDKAKYKEMIFNWFIAVILAFSMHYIMAFILAIMEEILNLLSGLTGVIEVIGAEDINFKTNLIGLARFQIQQQHFSAKIGYLVIYTALVVFTFKFTFIYLKRVLEMAFLTVIAPIVAVTYPIDKMDGEAKGFQMWLKEYVFNALLQPMHYLLYYILVSSSLTLAAKNPIYGIVALLFISQAEKLLKRIFGFNKAKAGTVGGIAGAFMTGAITSSLIKHVKNPLHPLGGGKENAKNSEKLQNNNFYGDQELPNDITEDTTNIEELLKTDLRGIITAENQQNLHIETKDFDKSQVPQIVLNEENFLKKYRKQISKEDELSFNDGIPSSMEDILKMLEEYQKRGKNNVSILNLSNFSYEDLKNILRNRVIANESEFIDNGFLPGNLGYIDGDSRTTEELMEEVIRLNENGKNNEAQNLLIKVKRRMAQNEYIKSNGGVQSIKQHLIDYNESAIMQERNIETGAHSNNNDRGRNISQYNKEYERQREENVLMKIKHQPVTKGLTNVGKRIIKPVWDTEKDIKYNGKKLVGNILKSSVGLSVGIAASAVQAGISITDGKYHPMEGVATVGAGMIGVSQIGKKVKGVREELKQDDISIKKYEEQWFNRDDIINSYNIEFPGKGKEMRRRAVNNYVSRGIIDFKDQKQAIKYANKIMMERGINEEEADKIAAATLQYKQTLNRSSNYAILYDKKKREDYINIQANIYKGSAPKKSIKKVHEDLIQNVIDFDKVNG